MNIEVLGSEVINQIAAGEVVERPSHLVKELVENSLDSGATQIEVEIAFGGRQVKIQDNGCGIAHGDLPLALARHATSKIRGFSDLWSLSSYGFRGEALASIAAVSRVKLVSRAEGQEEAYQLESEFGKFEDPLVVGGEQGTTIVIQDLFENVPARLKFLKSDAAESTQIKNVLRAMAMAYPYVAFRVRHNGKLLFYWPACKNRQSRVQQVLEQESMYIGRGTSGRVRAEAVISSPNNTVGTRRQIWMFAQNRWVQNSGMQAAVMDAYRNLLMHGEYPIVALWVDCDPDEIDVNIHPTKSMVRFRQASDSFKSVLRAVRGCLEKAPWVNDLLPQEHLSKGVKTTSPPVFKEVPMRQTKLPDQGEEFLRTQFAQKSFDFGSGAGGETKGSIDSSMESPPSMSVVKEPSQPYSLDRVSSYSNNKFNGGSPHILPEGSSLELFEAPESSSQSLPEKVSESSVERSLPKGEELAIRSVNKEKIEVSQEVVDTSGDQLNSESTHWSRLQVLGQTNLTYIVTQSDHSILFIDQHAAHERVAFERLMRSWINKKFEVQPFLIPEVIRLSEDSIEAILRIKNELSEMGLSIDQMGAEEIRVNSSPSIIKAGALRPVFEKLASDLINKGGSFALEKYVGDLFASMACHSVIRAGQALSHKEMESLLVQMDEFPLSSFCPHGRPVYVEYRFSKLEKDFGRIL